MTHEQWNRDSLITVGALTLLVPAFVFGIFVPGNEKNQELSDLLQQREREILEIPVRMAELDHLKRELDRRRDFLRDSRSAIPAQANDHQIIRELHHASELSGLQLSQIGPEIPTQHSEYSSLPISLTFRGSFQQVAEFLRLLEQDQRVLKVNVLSILRVDGQFAGNVEGHVDVIAFACPVDFDDSAGNADRTELEAADTRNAGSAELARFVNAPK